MISVGIDVSKGKSTVCILKPYGEIVSKPFNITHSLVTEESINDAQAKAKKGLEKYMGDTQIMPLNEMSISVDYASGSKKEWTKGNFITVSIVAHIKSNCFITPKVTTVSSMVMIEH